MMTGEHRLAGFLQPLVQGANVFRFRAVVVTVQLLVFDDRNAPGPGQCHQHLRLLRQTIEDVLRRVDHGLIEQRQRLDLFFTLTAEFQRLHRADLQRQHLTDGLTGTAQLVRHMQRLAVATADQAQSLSPLSSEMLIDDRTPMFFMY